MRNIHQTPAPAKAPDHGPAVTWDNKSMPRPINPEPMGDILHVPNNDGAKR